MVYTIDKNILATYIDEEVSKVADEAYGENGVSLYDGVVLTEKDADTVSRLIDDAVNGIASRMFDICKFSSGTNPGDVQLIFYVPDFDNTMEDAAKSELTHFIVFSACTTLFKSRRAQAVPEYTDRAQAAINKAVTILKSRKSPTEIW